MVSNRFSRVVSGILIAGILGFLLVSSPAKAFIMNISLKDNIILAGQFTTATVSAEVQEGENLNVKTFTLVLDGPQNRECSFLPNGTLLSTCDGITIVALQIPEYVEYGYGYSYGYYDMGIFKFNVTLDSGYLSAGDYKIKLLASVGDEIITSSQQKISIIHPINSLAGCSLRAKDGSILFMNKQLPEKNKLNVNVPLNNAKSGEGSFTSQGSKDRISYDFNVLSASRANNNFLIFNVSGTFKSGMGAGSKEYATIIFDLTKMKAYLSSDKMKADNLDITFAKC